MVAVWTQTLMSAAEISNFFSALGVVLCFICMVVFILRVQGMQLSSTSVVHVGQPSPVQVQFQRIGIPFVCFLHSKSIGESELQFKLTVNVACYIKVFWSISASQLKELLYMSWEDFAEKLDDINLDAKKIEDERVLEPDTAKETRIITLNKDENHVPLGKAPRTAFPLVVVVKRKDIPVPLDIDSNVGALISIIHISDDDCPMPTTILFQYLKQYSGQLTQLQALYTQRTEPNLNEGKKMEDQNLSSSFSNPFENELNEEGACVICRVMQPTRALLPCRHVCVCSLCFSRLEEDVCPLCRARVSAYFLTDAREEARQREMSAIEARQREADNLNRHRSFLKNMNGVLNSVLGLREQ